MIISFLRAGSGPLLRVIDSRPKVNAWAKEQEKKKRCISYGSFWTLGIPYKTLAGIGSIPACFITMQKVKNPDF